MRFPLHIVTDQFTYQVGQSLRGRKRYPLVLMLEPLYTCNLACLGCSPERHTGKLKDRLSLDECMQAVEDSGAPTVSICGGEPTLYPELPELIQGMIERKRHVYLCTNTLAMEANFFPRVKPHKRISINIHLDGMAKTHDYVCAREGVFDHAIKMIKLGKKLGFHVVTNTTIFKETEMEEVEELCALLQSLGVDGMMIAPGYDYETVELDMFLSQDDMSTKFERVIALSKKYRLHSTPLFLEFAAGKHEFACSPWSTVTRTPLGWRGPCYLIGEKLYPTWDEFWNGVDWDYWETRQDSRCRNCRMHSGFEASAVREATRHPRELLRLAAWNFTG